MNEETVKLGSAAIQNPNAFPMTWHPDFGWSPRETPEGMTLRDYFAAKALTGLMGGGWQNDGNPFNEDRANRTAKIAFAFADAMLKERAK